MIQSRNFGNLLKLLNVYYNTVIEIEGFFFFKSNQRLNLFIVSQFNINLLLNVPKFKTLKLFDFFFKKL